MKTPKILMPALRQYRHNDCSGFVAGFDHNETVEIIKIMESAAKRLWDSMTDIMTQKQINLIEEVYKNEIKTLGII